MPRFVRFRQGGSESYGVLDGDSLRALRGDLFGDNDLTGPDIAVSDVTILPPVRPWKILAAAVNYQSHVPSGKTVLKDDAPPAIPQLFLKPTSSIIGTEDTIVLPEGAPRVDAEGELVAVIGRNCSSVSPEEALDYVFGYTCGNDVSGRHWQRDDLQWWRAKGCDTFSPIGPAIASGLDPDDLELITRLNGVEVQSSSTSEMVHSTAKLISFASRAMTLEPGDLVFTGTPGEPPRLNDGDVVEVEIAGIGVLRNSVKRAAG
ncbi:MAG: fumarylacetoacetate hydrolase family protein [Chloroflexi bacterium]|nr:fumarylacetoacetate hydrolase family protein [Chloroflexota bacterium]